MSTDPTIAYDWSFPIDWGGGFEVTREYRTDVLTSRSGKERRRAQRSTPRIAFAGQTLLSGDEYREFKGLMAKRQQRPFTMPDWSRRVRLSAPANDGDFDINLVDTPSWLVAGRAIYLFDGRGRAYKAIVESIGSGTITLVNPVERDWSTKAVVLPGPVGFFPTELAASNPTNAVATVPLNFAVEAASEPAPAPAAPAVSLAGREICELQPNWAAGIDQTLLFGAEMVDFGRGVTSYTFPFDFPSNIRRGSYVGADADEVQELVDLFDRMKGQRGEFYLPSGENDLPPKTGLSSGAATLRVAGTDTATFYAGSTVYAAVCVVLRNGTRIYRKVLSVTTNAGDTVLTMTANWGTTLTTGDIRMVSWMPVWRFASDEMTVTYVTDSVATVDFNLRMLENLEPESLA